MKLIRKTAPPNSLIEYQKQTNISYEDIDSDVKRDIYKSLISEQKGVCAYCQQVLGSEFKIEHHCERSICRDKTLDYNNMLAVCKGISGSKPKLLHCDAKKATFNASSGLPIGINPTIKAHIDTIRYASTGLIESTNSKFNQEINVILNLNINYLKRLRKKKWIALMKSCAKDNNRINKTKLIRILEKELAANSYSTAFPGLNDFLLKKYKKV